MKKQIRLVVAACVLAAINLSAQSNAVLNIQTYAGLTITGEIGKVYSVECVTDLVETDWRCLEYLQLPASPYLWVDKSASATGRRFYRAVAMEAPTNMVFIPPGTFRMGSPLDEEGRYADEGPQMTVTISRGFWMGQYEVTQREYLNVMGNNPSWFNGDRTSEGGANYGVDLNRPVEWVSLADVEAYCSALTQQERLAGHIATNEVYRIPTEAEWEYACRAGTSTRFSYGEDPGYTNLDKYSWYYENSSEQTHPVGQKLPNPWGLYDMNGNVFERCQDWYDPEYPGGFAVDPQGPASGTHEVIRGGNFRLGSGKPNHLRSAFRAIVYRETRERDFGFRVLLAPDGGNG